MVFYYYFYFQVFFIVGVFFKIFILCDGDGDGDGLVVLGIKDVICFLGQR